MVEGGEVKGVENAVSSSATSAKAKGSVDGEMVRAALSTAAATNAMEARPA